MTLRNIHKKFKSVVHSQSSHWVGGRSQQSMAHLPKRVTKRAAAGTKSLLLLLMSYKAAKPDPCMSVNYSNMVLILKKDLLIMILLIYTGTIISPNGNVLLDYNSKNR